MNGMKRVPFGALVIILCGLFVALTGCGSSGGSTTGHTTSGATATATGSSGGSSHCSAPSSDVTVNGIKTVKFCGPAKAQATFGGQSASWSDGNCLTQSGIFTVNIGQEAVDGNPNDLKKFDYFGIDVTGAKGDGTYQQVVVTGVYHGQQYILSGGTVTLTGNMTAGTFTGTDLTTQATVSGSFTCQ